jgi:outer membrane protein
MWRIVLNKSLVAMVLLGGLLGASTLVTAEGLKIAYVRAEKAVENSPQYAAFQKELQQTFEPRAKDLESKVKQYKKMQEDMERDQAIMSDTQLQKVQREMIALERRIKNAKEELEQDSAIRSNELRLKLVKIVNEVIQELAKADNLDMVVNETVVVYVNSRIDITDKVIEKLKQKFKGSN